MMDSKNLRELAGIALAVAEEAAAVVQEGFVGETRVREKGDADLVTDVDLASERLIRERLRERTPEIAIVGEEQGGDPAGPTWYCDPIDGTTNFVHGLPFFCVSLGLLDGRTALAGAVVAPALGRRYTGYCAPDGEREATCNGRPCHVSSTPRLDQALVATGFPPRDKADQEANLACVARALPVVRGLRRCGSAALDLAMVADGTFDVYWERMLNAWDIAGGIALVRAAGGTVTDLRGGSVDPARGHLLATNGPLHAAALALLDE